MRISDWSSDVCSSDLTSTQQQRPTVDTQMNRRVLVKAIAAYTDVDAKTVDAVLKGCTDVTTHVVAKGEPVAITGFAQFAKVERAARMGRNPATGAAITIKASNKASITHPNAQTAAVL